MSTTITGKLNDAANQFQAGDSTGFGIRLGVKARNPKTKEDEWCNYSAVIFAKSPGQIQFYQDALVSGSVIEISCDQLLIDSYESNEGKVSLSVTMVNARLGYVHAGQSSPQQQSGAPQQAQAPQQTQAPQAKDYTQDINAYWALDDQARAAHWGRLSSDVQQAIIAANG